MSEETAEQLNLIPQWLKKGPSASPRHAQAPAPPPQPKSEKISGEATNNNHHTNSSAGRGRGEGGPGQSRGGGSSGGRGFHHGGYEQRRPGTNQGSFEGGRFTMGDTDRGQPAFATSDRPPVGSRRPSGNAPPTVSTTAGETTSSSRGHRNADYYSSSSSFSTAGGSSAFGGSMREGPPPLSVSSHSAPPPSYASRGAKDSSGGPAKLQYTRDEILDLAVASAFDSSLFVPDLPEGIVSVDWLEPELRKQFDPEDIYNAWYDSLQSERRPGGGGLGRGAGGAERGHTEGPPRVGGTDWRNPPTWRAPKPSAFSDDAAVRRGDILPPSGGMGLDKMAIAAEQFAKEMAATIARGGMNFGSDGPPAQLKGLLGESTGNSILDEPLEEGLDRPPEEEVVPREEAIDFEEGDVKDALPAVSELEAEEELARKLAMSSLDTGSPPHQPSLLPPLVGLDQGGSRMGAGASRFMGVGGPQQQLPSVPGGPFGGLRGPGLPLGSSLGGSDPWGHLGGGGLDLLSAGSVFPSANKPQQPQQPSQQQQQPGFPSSMRTSSLLPPARTGAQGVPQQQPPQQQQQPQQLFAPQMAPQMPVMDDWFYMDPQNAIQGPFSSKEMKEWFDAGYFKPELLVSYGQPSRFLPLISLYNDLRTVFIVPPRGASGGGNMQQLPVHLGQTIMNPNQQQQQQQQMIQQQQQQQMAKQRMMEEQQARAIAEEQQRQQQMRIQQQDQHERQRREEQQQQRAAAIVAEQERLRREEEIRQQQQRILEEQQRAAQAAAAAQQQQAKQQQQQQQQQQAPWSTAAQQPSQAMSLAQIRAEEERQKKQDQEKSGKPKTQQQPQSSPAATPSKAAQEQPQVAQQPTSSSKPAGTPWGKSNQDPIRAPTLKEIQEAEEEERKRAAKSQGDGPPMTMASHLAKAAGIETRTWSSTVPNPSTNVVPEVKKSIPSSVLSPPPAQPRSAAALKAATTAAPKPAAASASATQAPAASAPAAQKSSAQDQKKSSAPSDVVFGSGTMSSEFRMWCEENAPSIAADMALLEFCYGVDNAEEVKETFTGYLGYKPNVLSFVDEFIRRVNLDKNEAYGRGKSQQSGGASASASSGGADEWKSKGGKKKRG